MLKAGEACEAPFMPWVSNDFNPVKQVPKEAMVAITCVQMGKNESTYELAVNPSITVADVKKRVEAECQGLVKAANLELKMSEEQKPLADDHKFCFMEGDLIIVSVNSKPNAEQLKALQAKKGCCVM